FSQRLGLCLLFQFHLYADVALRALPSQFNLPLTLSETLLLLLGMLVVAMRAAHSFNEMLGGLVCRAERQAARAAEFVIPGLQTVTHRYALVENEAVAFPEARILRHGLQILQNAAFQVIDLVVAERAHVSGGLLAAY